MISFFIYPNILKESQEELLIEIDLTKKKDNSSDITKDKKKPEDEERTIGNKWYSRNNLYINSAADIGFSGTKDYFSEESLFIFKFKSKIKHAFGLRFYHLGYAPGLFSGNFTFYNFSITAGFEYLLKIFSATEGFFVWSDFGGSNKGYSFDLGIGFGNRMRNGFEMDFKYLHNVGVFSKISFYFLFIDLLTLKGKIGIDYNFNEVFTFLTGLSLGFQIKERFKIEFGGGITLNEYAVIRGFGTLALSLNLL